MSRLYYLIATLPEFDPLDNKTPLEADGILDTIMNNVEDQDKEEVRMIVVKNDIRNIVIHFASKNGTLSGNPMPYRPSLMPIEQIDEWTYSKELWPDFLVNIMEEFQAEIPNMSETELTRLLWGEYYDELENHNPFLREIMQNYVIMHDILGLIRSKNLDLGLWDHWIGYVSQLEDIKSGRLTLSGMAQEHENFNNLKSKTLDAESWEAESWCDELLIRKSEQLLGILPFDTEHLLHYTYKLLFGAKWRELNKEHGKARFEFLKKELIKEIDIPSVI